MTLHRDVLKIEDRAIAVLDSLLDEQQRALIAAWITTWDQVSGELLAALDELTAANVNGTVTRAQMLRSRRLQAALQAVVDALDQVATQAGVTISFNLHAALSDSVSYQVRMVAAQLPREIGAGVTRTIGTSVIAASPEQVTAIVQRVTQRITSQTWALSLEARRAIKRELLRSIAVGSNPRVAARRAVASVEGIFEGGLGRALTIARTEQIDAHREAARIVHDANSDVLAGWTWVAHLGPRTCRACLAMHGREFPLTQAGPEGHQRCRCVRVPRTKTWAELGITGVKDRKPAIKDAEQHFRSLPVEDQKAILGANGYAAWKAGLYPMSDWVRKQKNDGWRDSWTATRPPAVPITS